MDCCTGDILYRNDGLYSCFSFRWPENQVFTPVWAPACNSVCPVTGEAVVDCEVKVGDFLQDLGRRAQDDRWGSRIDTQSGIRFAGLFA